MLSKIRFTLKQKFNFQDKIAPTGSFIDSCKCEVLPLN